MSSAPHYIFEQTDFSLRLARCAGSERPLRIDELKEVSVEEAGALVATVAANATVVCAVRSKSRSLRLASAEESKLHAGLAGVRNFVKLPSAVTSPIQWFAAVQARDGMLPAAAPWLLSSSTDAHPQEAGILEGLKSRSVRYVSATHVMAGALANTAERPVLLIEVGELASHALLVGRDGVLAAGAISLDLNQIAEAVQAELSLKFRGSAIKLFFNPDYDFSDVGQKIAARLAAPLKADLARLLSNRPAASGLFVAGLPASQQWFGPQLAATLGLTIYAPDTKALSAAAGLTFATAEVASALTPAWLGVLRILNSSTVTKQPSGVAWIAEWLSIGPSTNAAAPVAALPVTSTPVVPPAVAAAKPTPSSPKPQTSGGNVKSLIAAASEKASVPAAKAAPSSVKYSTKSATSIAGLDQVTAHKTQSPQPVSGAKQASPQKAAEVSVPKPSAAPQRSPASSLDVSKPPRKKNLTWLVVSGIAVLLLLAAGLYFFDSQTKVADRLAHEKHQAEQRLKKEETKARLAEQKAREEAESRKKIEAEFTQKLGAAVSARQQAESEALAQTAARLANARGVLVITTSPAGARVAVGNLPPQVSPATFSDVKIGTYPVLISLPLYDDVNLELGVKENGTTESGLITLTRISGGLKITAEPGSATYELHPANTLMIAPESRRTGPTPANIEDLSPGDYSVTLTREGWAPRTEVVSIRRDATQNLVWQWPNAAVKITSIPAGATVMHSGTTLGVTPLVLTDQAPADVQYVLISDHFDPISLAGRIEGGKDLELSGEFKPEDRFFTSEEVDRKPEPVSAKMPELPYYLTLENGRVEIELMVNRDGSTKNIHVVQASHADLGKFCQATVQKWQFKPGLKSGSPVNVKLRLPFVFKAKS